MLKTETLKSTGEKQGAKTGKAKTKLWQKLKR
jgi:hypothetical protein